MKKGDKLTLDISSVGMNGEGVARIDGFVVFVPQTLVGEKVTACVTSVKKSFATARVVKVVSPSEDRVAPQCRICFKCGGCEMLHIKYQRQLEIKRAHVKNCIDRECGIDCRVDETVPSPEVYGYRNKIQLPITIRGGKVAGGYFEAGTHNMVPFCAQDEKSCCVLHGEDMQGIVDIFLRFVGENKLTVYDEDSHSGLIRHLVIRRVGGKYSICVVVNGESLPEYKRFAKALQNDGYDFSLYISPNLKRTNVIMGEKAVLLCGDEALQAETLGIKYSVSPKSFMQVNDKVRDIIYRRVGDIIKNSNIDNVVDAYSGIGIMSNIFAKYADKVYAIEIEEQAVKDGMELAKVNGNQDKIINICGDCAEELPKLISRIGDALAVLDPPRKGCDKSIIQSLLDAAPRRIVYISCNPATLARDIKMLLSGYDLASVTPYDMFPHTKHVETLVCLDRKRDC